MNDFIKPLRTDPYDRRLAERHLRSGLIQPEDLRKHLDALPDVADNAEEIKVALGEDSGEGR